MTEHYSLFEWEREIIETKETAILLGIDSMTLIARRYGLTGDSAKSSVNADCRNVSRETIEKGKDD